MPQSESHGEIRAELPFILDIPGAFHSYRTGGGSRKKRQVRRNKHRGSRLRKGVHFCESIRKGVQESGREDMRFLHTQSQRAVAIVGNEVRVGGRTPGVSIIIVV